MRRFFPMVAEWTTNEEGQALLAMLVDDFYQESLHAPPVPPVDDKPVKRGDRAPKSSGKQDGKRQRRSGKRRRSGSKGSGGNG